MTWAEIIQRRISLFAKGRRPDLQSQFERDKFWIYRDQISAGRGRWFAAYSGEVPIGDMGLLVDSAGEASIQEVLVYPEFRGAGLGRQMIADACAKILESHQVERYIAITQANSIAEQMYRGLGFLAFGSRARSLRLSIA